MERRGSITEGMHQAGEDFRARFAVAQLDPLRALDLSHLRVGDRSLRPDSGGPGLRIEAARTAVWRAVQAVGGIASPAGSCLWHVIGWERSLKEWAFEQGLERPAGQPGSRLRHPRRGPRRARGAFRPERIVAFIAFLT